MLRDERKDYRTGNIVVRGRKYYRPGTEMLSALDGNIIVLGRGRDGNVLALDGIDSGIGRN